MQLPLPQADDRTDARSFDDSSVNGLIFCGRQGGRLKPCCTETLCKTNKKRSH